MALSSARIVAEKSYRISSRNFSKTYGIDFPRGMNVDQVVKTFLDNNGWDELRKVVKLPLMNTEKVA